MVDYIADYLANIRSRRVYPAVSPGYLRNVLPASAPVDGEPWEDIFADIEKCIMPGVTHWQSPHMHAYFPALNSPASLLADMLADAINCLGFTWVRTMMRILDAKTKGGDAVHSIFCRSTLNFFYPPVTSRSRSIGTY